MSNYNDGEVFKGTHVEHIRRKFNRLRRGLQMCGTRSARRRMKRVSGREKRFKRDINHQISKAIVSKAKDTTRAIALEDLRGFRTGVTVRHKDQKDRRRKWSFGQLREFVEYKARREGVPLYIVEARNTSRTCPRCGLIDSRNRTTREQFKCFSCGYEDLADCEAAINIAAGAPINEPIVATLFSSAASPDEGQLMTV